MIDLFINNSAILITIFYFLLFIAHLYVYAKHKFTNKYTLARGFMLLSVSLFYGAIFTESIELSIVSSAQVARLIWIAFGFLFIAELIEDNRKNGC